MIEGFFGKYAQNKVNISFEIQQIRASKQMSHAQKEKKKT
jgi:hypothetical protein